MKNQKILQQFLESTPLYKQWQNISICSHHGIMIPLFSLRSEKSCGIGEFFDLAPLIEWSSELGFKVIQLLPINDSGDDPSPYNSLSSCALDPIYLSLHRLSNPNASLQNEMQRIRTLNNTKKIHHAKVRKVKYVWLEKYFHDVFPQMKTLSTYQNFCKENPWLDVYTKYRVLREKLNNTDWTAWPEKYQAQISLEKKEKQRAEFYTFLQFLCFEQLIQIKTHAEKHHVLLKGDIPILISNDSADVWSKKHLFNQTFSVGAPPDAYNAKGQTWGFPLFNWDAHAKENFSWWKQRLNVAQKFYHLYRLDHVVGFFRLWAVNKKNNRAIDGFFYPQNPYIWSHLGKELLLSITTPCAMLPIAEDLGTIPPFVFSTLKELGICGTRVMRWERNWDENASFIPIDRYSSLSLTTLTTHDSPPLEMWWQKHPLEVKNFCLQYKIKYSENLSFEQRMAILKLSHQTTSLFHINPLQEYLALFEELVWERVQDERINTPGTNSPNNWTYVLRQPLEKILSNKKLKDAIKNILV